MRQEFKKLKWALYLVIFVFVALIFVDWGMGRYQGKVEKDYAAIVGREKITPNEFYRAYENQKEMYRQTYKDRFNEDLLRSLNLSQSVLNELVQGRMMQAQAAKAGVAVSAEQVTQEIAGMKAFQKQDGTFVGYDTYRRVLAANNMTPKYFEAQVGDDAVRRKYAKLLQEAIVLPESETFQEYKKRNLSAAVDYVLLAESKLQGEVSPGEADLKAYYEAHKADYWQPEKRKINYLLVDTQKIKGTVKIPDADVKEYYDLHADEYRTDEQVHARHILIKTEGRAEAEALALANTIKGRLDKGEDFAALAKQFSDDPGSKDKGGDLGFFGKGQMVPEFEAAAFGLPPNAISGPIKTMYGFHVIQTLNLRPPGQQSLEEVAGQIHSRLQEERAAGEAEARSKRVYRRIQEDGLKSEAQLKALPETDPSLTYNTTEWFGLADFIPGIGRTPDLSNAVFAMKEGDLTPMLKGNRGFMVARLAGIRPQGVADFVTAKAEVLQAVKKQKAMALARQRVSAVASLDLEAIAKALGTEVKKDQPVRYLTPAGPLGASAAVHEAIFAASPGQKLPPMDVQGGWAVIEVKKADRPDMAKYAQQRAEIVQSLRQSLVTQLMNVLLDAEKARTDIQINAAFLKQVS
jgi:peptidyl-prolyl cis-trans isomerase D